MHQPLGAWSIMTSKMVDSREGLRLYIRLRLGLGEWAFCRGVKVLEMLIQSFRVTIATVHRERLGLEIWTLPESEIGGLGPPHIHYWQDCSKGNHRSSWSTWRERRRGRKYDVGQWGAIGLKGDGCLQGMQEDAGAKVFQGVQWAVGATGVQGPIGTIGDKHERGTKGDVRAKGDRGRHYRNWRCK